MMAAWAEKMAECGKRTAIIVDRIELVSQTFRLLSNASVLQSTWSDQFFNEDAPVHIIMLQTANRRMNTLLNIKFDYIFFDEIHQYCEGQMFEALCECQPQAKIIGVSATPIDDKGYLLEGFDDCIGDVQVQMLIDAGYLVKPSYFTPSDYNLNLQMIRLTNGDYNVGQLDEVMANTQCSEKIYKHWKKQAELRKTLAFCTSIKQAEIMSRYFQSKGCNAQALSSNVSTIDRKQMLEDFASGKIRVLFNVGILVAGFDDPTVECILFANPTKILRRYLQQCGRGLRPASNKTDCIMLDCADIVKEHGFCNDLRFFRKAIKRRDRSTVKQCPECGAIVNCSDKICRYCGYDFSAIEEKLNSTQTKKEIEKLEKAFNMQQELKKQISDLVDQYHYKSGYKWFLFIDCLKTKRPTESSLQFFKRKLTKINKIKKYKWNIASLRYN